MDFETDVLAIHQRLREAEISHAFGGALALDFIAEPRGTADVDVNTFLPSSEVDDVVEALSSLGYRREDPDRATMPGAGIKLVAPGIRFPLDVFPALDESYDEVERRVVEHPFGPDRVPLPFLSAEDLVVFKLSFGRSKDWVDLESVARAGAELDLDYVERKVVELRGPTMYPRVARLRHLFIG